MTDDDMILLTSRTERNPEPKDKDHFKDVLHLMTQRILNIPVTV